MVVPLASCTTSVDNGNDNACVADAALSRPLALARATTFTSNDPVIGTAMVALPPDAVADANAGTTLTCEMVPTKFSLVSFGHPPSVTGPFADMM